MVCSTAVVKRVVDGDTLELESGQRVRLLGIDTPERGESMADEASAMLEKLIGSNPLELISCRDTDPYGRLLSVVRADDVNVNVALIREGVALPLLIPPCGSEISDEILRNASIAAKNGKGLYSGEAIKVVSHLDADDHIGSRVMVRGKVLALHRGRKAWHLNFGEDYRTDFTAVLFDEGRSRFREFDIDPGDLVGAEVLVIGKVKRYNGPEIILRGPDQILVLNPDPVSGSPTGSR
ncbi:MAG: thermonuclease family protein [bacterium]|nr:thermonuclease family protein [bacterium]